MVLQAPEALCRARWTAGGKGQVAAFSGKMGQYQSKNLTDNVHCLADFFQDVAKIGVFNLPVAGKDQDDIFESGRIYMEREGRPINYLPTEEEVAKELLERFAAKAESGEQAQAASKR